ncbi:MAG: 4Fe-4S dicluster domain-containing protein [Deltaproteobacteria bacterium]|nr:4Fe-4S dicluster domain-containing protein [Deltaproteobacteria bacterium]
MSKGMKRRDFFKVAATSGAAVAVVGCTEDPVEKIIPMLVPPSDYVPAVSIHFATTCQECAANCGLIIRTREGRAIKAEGNPEHPLSGGGICAIGQSSLQGMYSPSRAKSPATQNDGSSSLIGWDKGLGILSEKLEATKAKKGKVLYIGPARSGSINKLIDRFVKGLGSAKYLRFDSSPTNSIKQANQITFNKNEIPDYQLEKAKTLISFGADFLESWVYPVKLTKSYTEMHAFKHGVKGKYYHVSPHMSLTGSNADEWVSCPSGGEAIIALGIANQLLGKSKISGSEKKALRDYLEEFSAEQVASQTGVRTSKLEELAKEFGKNGKSIAIAGGNTAGADATQLQVAVNILNYVAGNIGQTIVFGADYRIGGDSTEEIVQALKDAGKYDIVFIENVNPAYALPQDSGVVEALKGAPFVVSLSTERDETSALAHLHLPTSHYFESWGDSTPRNGVFGLQQPVMAKLPMFSTKEIGDLILLAGSSAGLSGFDADNYQEYLKEQWQAVQKKMGDRSAFQTFWTDSLKKGGQYRDFSSDKVSFSTKALKQKVKSSLSVNGMTLLAVNTTLHHSNGAAANRSWLMEVPHPITQIVWDSWVEIHPKTAVKLGIKHGDLVEVKTPKGSLELAAYFYYGIEENTLVVPAGMGRSVPFPTYKSSHGKSIITPVIETKSDLRVEGFKVGENAAGVLPFKTDAQSGDLVFTSGGVSIKPLGKKAYLVTMDGQFKDDIEALEADTLGLMGDRSQKGRGFVQTTTMGNMLGHSEEKAHGHHLRHRLYTMDRKDNTDFYDPREEDVAYHAEWAGKKKPKYYDPYKWEMSIDLDRCTGCSACVVACYAENNIPVVGKDRNAVGREMSWLRIERYIEKNEETGTPEIYYTPEMCNQCGNAGCEPVCPVYATYHNEDGINAMIYNRCVGTRYCSNNCVYKQRKYNWRSYEFPSPLHLQLNPAMTVREMGVMEKCNFCYSRIREMKDIAKDQGRVVADSEIKTACQQTCNAKAITFGNIMDKQSQVNKIVSTTKRGYKQLEEVNFKPSITYLKKVKHNNRKA